MLPAEFRAQIRQVATSFARGVTHGRVMRAAGTVIEACVPHAHIGDLVRIELGPDREASGEVVGFREDTALVMPFGDIAGISPGVRRSSCRL